MQRAGLTTLVLTLLVAWASEATAQLVPAATAELSLAELRRLERGRIVVRQRQGMSATAAGWGGRSWLRINAPPEAVWHAALDTPRYPELLPHVTEARTLRDGPDGRVVFVRHGRGFVGARYTLVVCPNEETMSVRFSVDRTRPGSLRDGRGSLTVHPWGEDQSVVVFEVDAVPYEGMLSSLFRHRIQAGLLRTPYVMKRFIEGSGRSLYVRG